MAEPRIVVIGGGIIGLCCAYYARRSGAAVTVVERSRVGAGASSGNAGWIVPVLSSPLPGPHLRGELLASMGRREAPFRVRPTFDPGVWAWLWRFRRACTARRSQAGLLALAALNERTMDLYDGLVADGVGFEMHRDGVLLAFLDDHGAREELATLRPMAGLGYRLPGRPMGGADLRALEPALSDQVRAGFLVETERSVVPMSLLRGLTIRLGEMGVDVLEGSEVTGFDASDGRVRAVVVDTGPVEAEAVVLAAGTSTAALAAMLGLPVPLLGAKGFSFSVRPALLPSRPIWLSKAKVACSPMGDRLRVAGTVELGRPDLAMDQRRLGAMLQAARAALTGNGLDDVWEAWAGLRPVAPDGLPIVGRPARLQNVFLATGHSTLGMTLGPATGEALAEQIATGAAPARLAPFSPDRF